jgi:uncharacterized membrane protein YebE (DUF533 family)
MNAFDILGSLMQGGMRPSAGRLQDMLGRQGPGGMFGGGPGGFPGGGMPPGGMPGSASQGGTGGLFDMLEKVAGPMMSGAMGGASSGGGSLPFDMLKQIGGAIFSGQGGPNVSGSTTTAAGAGAMSVFGALAAQALQVAKQMMAEGGSEQGGAPAGRGGFDLDDAAAIIAGLRKPANAEEEHKIEDMATLTIRAMINAAKADGQIDPQEAQRLLGKMQEDGVTEEERQFVLTEMQKPMETDAIAAAVPSQQAAAQIYTASLMAIQVDTDAEKRYMQELAGKLGLNQHAVGYLHQAVGLA